MAVTFVNRLEDHHRYRDVFMFVRDFFSQIRTHASAAQIAYVDSAFATAARMIGEHSICIEVATRLLEEQREILEDARQAHLYISMALACQKVNAAEKAQACALIAKKLAKTNTCEWLQASAILVEIESGEDGRHAALEKLERRARNVGCIVVANNIALDLAREGDRSAARKLVARVTGTGDRYNEFRAYIRKSEMVIEKGERVPDHDRSWLQRAYSYLFCQELEAMFDSCHDVIWSVLEADNNRAGLLRLFRYSSFIWRLHGASASERAAITKGVSLELGKIPAQAASIADVRYFKHRVGEVSG